MSFRSRIKLNGYCANCCKEIGKHKIIETNFIIKDIIHLLDISL